MSSINSPFPIIARVLVLPLQDDDFALEKGRLELLEKMPGQRMVGIYHSPVQLQVQ